MVFINRNIRFWIPICIFALGILGSCTSNLFQMSPSRVEVLENQQENDPGIKGLSQLDVRRLNGRLGHFSESNPIWASDGDYLIYQAHPEEKSPEVKAAQIQKKGNSLQFEPVPLDNQNLNSMTSLSSAYPVSFGREPSFQESLLKEFPDHALSPDEEWVAFVYLHQGIRNIAIMKNWRKAVESSEQPFEREKISKTERPITQWQFESFKPSWSPDGQYIAFYTSYNPAAKPGVWSIGIVPHDDFLHGIDLADRILVHDIQIDSQYGPEWSPDGKYLIYVKKGHANPSPRPDPIFATQIHTGETYWLDTGTDYNQQIRCSKTGILVFQAAFKSQRRLFLATTDLFSKQFFRLSHFRKNFKIYPVF